MLSLQESVSIYNQGSGHPDAGFRARRQAVQLFWRVYYQGKRSQWWKSLTHRLNRLYELNEALQGRQVKASYALGVQNVPIARVQGSEGRCQDFDAAFHPTHNRTQERWVSIAVAQILEIALPPVELIQVGDAYYVRDGHHRISVAKALGQLVVEAQVTVWEI